MGLKTIAIHLGTNIVDLGVGTAALMGVGAGVAAIGTGVAAIGAIPVVAGVALGAACAVPAIIFAKATSYLVDFTHKKLFHPLEPRWVAGRTILTHAIKVFGCAGGIAIGVGAAAGIACIPALGLTVVSAATIIGAVATAAAIAFVARFVFSKITHFTIHKIASNYVQEKVDSINWNQLGDFTVDFLKGHFSLVNLTDSNAILLTALCNRIKNREDRDDIDIELGKKDVKQWFEILFTTGTPPNW